ncbi:hypothetical protein EGV01_08880, partial [Pseudomonas syringae pv. theae]|nr:hypothetical protein [Pseudomonas syringae pv. theae]
MPALNKKDASASFFVLAPVRILIQTLRVACSSGRSASDLELGMPEIQARLESPFRPSATYLCAQHG